MSQYLQGMQEAYDRVKELPQTTAHEIVIPEAVLNGMPEMYKQVLRKVSLRRLMKNY